MTTDSARRTFAWASRFPESLAQYDTVLARDASYRDAVRAALLYLLISLIWMQLSGYLLSSLFDNSAERLRWQLINGYVLAAFSAGLIGLAPEVRAQQQLERVEITGSSLRRVDAETALPVTVQPFSPSAISPIRNTVSPAASSAEPWIQPLCGIGI